MDNAAKKAAVLARRAELNNYGARKRIAAEQRISERTVRRWLREPNAPTVPSKSTGVRLDDLPLDDPRWLPIREAHRLINERARVGDAYIAARELTDALQTGKLPSLRRKRLLSDVGPERQLNTLDYWEDLALNAKAEVMRFDFPADPTDPIPVTPVTDFVFYVWEPNFEKLWPARRAG